MAPKLEKTFTMRGYINKENTLDLKAIKTGPQRIIVPIVSGFVKGSGLDAEILPGGADWILLDPSSNIAHIDVRTQARASNGHSLYIHYIGVLKMDEGAQKVLGWASDAKTTQVGDHHWFNQPIIETSDPEFKWVEDCVWNGQGHFVVDERGSAVEYEIYKVTN
ncbi:hypothetical protein EDD36DRAFT_239483 [Exophiala viscosa]|uniref:Uncharacterized protein n=1 Tax=Exophiala viscosa TaxID=2486360 RepID=A0AAN6DUT6_9EURO|nr:hypothetical protein EDD36DRAFT_239483 [Exophiala viscosa]